MILFHIQYLLMDYETVLSLYAGCNHRQTQAFVIESWVESSLMLIDIVNVYCIINNVKNVIKMIGCTNPNHTSAVSPNSFELMKISYSDRIISVTKHGLRGFYHPNRISNVHNSNLRCSSRSLTSCWSYGGMKFLPFSFT